MDRVRQLDSLWQVWKDNFITSDPNKRKDWDRQMPSQSIQAKSLEMIVDQLFAEIDFLRKENRVLKDESEQVKSMNTILKDNVAMGKQQKHIYTGIPTNIDLLALRRQRGISHIGVGRRNRDSVSDEDSGRHSTDSVTLASLEERNDDNVTEMTTIDAETENKDNATENISGDILDTLSDSISDNISDDYSSLREETIEKSNLLSSLTDKLLDSTTKYQEQLRQDQVYLQKITQRTATLNDFKIYNPDKHRKSGKTESESEVCGSSRNDSIRGLSCSSIAAPLLFENSAGELVA